MSRFPQIVAVAVALLSLTAGAAAQGHVEASRTAILRAAPDRTAAEVGRLAEGDRLNLIRPEQTDSFYEVRVAATSTAWVSRYTVRVNDGAVPLTLPAGGGGGAPAVTGGGAAEQAWADFHLAVGRPRGFRELVREGYVAGYDPRLKIPAWVQYRLTAARSRDDAFPRSNAYDEDVAVHAEGRATTADYAGSGYAQGHMAPADDMRWSERAELESNLLSNMAPQIGSTFNGSVWKAIENRVRAWAEGRGDLTIVCGPVFEPVDALAPTPRQPATPRQVVYNVIGERGVAVPTGFFKIVIDQRDPDRPEILAFLLRHVETTPGPERTPETYLSSVDAIEAATGLDLLPGLRDDVETAVESVVPTRGW